MAEEAKKRTALVIPGGRYGPHVPLLAYASDAARARGAEIRHITWSPPDSLIEWFEAAPTDPGADPMVDWVRGEVSPVLDELAGPPAGTGPTAAPPATAVPAVPVAPLLIGKSLGSCAAPLAAERGLPAVWLTPLLQREAVVRALRQASAPYLLIGGTADARCWDGALARSLSPHVLEVPDADHGMYVPGPLARSAAVLGRVITAIEDFLDQIVWPT